jgi:ABC-type multidrug transport system permease subunit
MGLNVMGSGLFGVGFFLVDMRVRKLLKRLVATPMKRSHFLLAVLGTRLLLLVPQMGLLLIVARLVFTVKVFGNPLAVALIVVVGSLAFSGIGLVLASRTDKIETISGLVNLVMLPGWLLSGTFFSAERFPAAAQPVIQALPLTQLNDALRAVMLEGRSLADEGVAWRLAALAAWGVVSFLLALRWFRWQ